RLPIRFNRAPGWNPIFKSECQVVEAERNGNHNNPLAPEARSSANHTARIGDQCDSRGAMLCKQLRAVHRVLVRGSRLALDPDFVGWNYLALEEMPDRPPR